MAWAAKPAGSRGRGCAGPGGGGGGAGQRWRLEGASTPSWQACPVLITAASLRNLAPLAATAYSATRNMHRRLLERGRRPSEEMLLTLLGGILALL